MKSEARTTQVDQSHSSFPGLNKSQINPAAMVPPARPPIRVSVIVEYSISQPSYLLSTAKTILSG